MVHAVIRSATACLAAVARRLSGDGPERGDATGWAVLAGLASVGTVALAARYQDLLVHALVTAASTPLGALPGG